MVMGTLEKVAAATVASLLLSVFVQASPLE
jgi:hypothetical protein